MNNALGRLVRVDLRETWKDESRGFTPWLAKEENLKLLGETLRLDLELESSEKPVGSFSADILCKNTVDDTWVLIENQLERTDHTHLGQLLTYASGLEAVTIIWVAQRFAEEHRAALDWLNEITDERFNFFGLEIELWRIGDSPPAPKFNIVSKPNNWSKAVQSAASRGQLSDAKQLQLKFWTAFIQHMEGKSPVKCQKPSPQHWMNHSIGRSGAHLTSIASTWDSVARTNGLELRVELYLDGKDAKNWFTLLTQEKDAIEREYGQSLIWHNPENAKMSRICLRSATDWQDEKRWNECFEWLRQNLELFTKVFGPRVMRLP